jgi:hypothetical protein
MDMPELPIGYRWKVTKCKPDPLSRSLGLDVNLQKRVGPIWWTVMFDEVKKGRSGETKQVMVVRTAAHVLDSYSDKQAELQEKESLIGIYQQHQV